MTYWLLIFSIALHLSFLFYYCKSKKNIIAKIIVMLHYCLLELIVCYNTSSVLYLLTMLIGGLLIIEDIEYMEVSIWKILVLISIAIVSLFSQFSFWTILAAFSYSLGLLLIRVLFNGMLGSADIIYIACITCIIGPIPAMYAVCIGCILSLLSIIPALKKQKQIPIPFLPGLCSGFGYALLIIPIVLK